MPDFPYINARVRAMRSRLLPSARLEELLGTPTMEAFLQGLATTPYASDLQEALVRYQGLRAVDEALTRDGAGLKLAGGGSLPEEQRLRFFIPGGAVVADCLSRALSFPQSQAPAWER